jgi:Nuclease-related domain
VRPAFIVAGWRAGAAALFRSGTQARTGAGNVDHILRSPSGTAYVIETKALNGRISVEHGVLTQRFSDDPKPHRYDDLAGRMFVLAERVGREWQSRRGFAPALRSVVVVWGRFDGGPIVLEDIVYVAGPDLADTLRRLDTSGL